MHSSGSATSILLGALLLQSQAQGFGLEQRADAGPRVLSMSFTQQGNPNARQGGLARRQDQGSLDVPMQNQDNVGYFIDIEIGTPPQKATVLLDTGSSDLWVPAKSWCDAQKDDPCKQSKSFVANDSSTYVYVNSALNVSYGDGSGALGDFATDVVSLAGATANDVQFGIAYDVDDTTGASGTFGVGFPLGEGIGSNGSATARTAYENFPARLVRDGLIASPAYSLFLNEAGADEGTIIFGGVDTERFEGRLTALPVLREEGDYLGLFVGLESISVGDWGLSTPPGGNATYALLDSGTTVTSLPLELAVQVFSQIDVAWDFNATSIFCHCDLRDQDTNITFGFAGLNISLPVSVFVYDGDEEMFSGTDFLDKDDNLCGFGMQPGAEGDDLVILGGTFLRSVYAVYDLENKEISLAPARYGSDRSNIVEITRAGVNGTEASPRQGGGDDDSAGAGVVPASYLVGGLLMAVISLVVL